VSATYCWRVLAPYILYRTVLYSCTVLYICRTFRIAQHHISALPLTPQRRSTTHFSNPECTLALQTARQPDGQDRETDRPTIVRCDLVGDHNARVGSSHPSRLKALARRRGLELLKHRGSGWM
jgi:hypothetical protein